MKRKIMAAIMLTVLALSSAACSTPYTKKIDDATEAISALPEDVVEGQSGAVASTQSDVSDELIEAIEELPVDPVDAVSGPDSGARPENVPAGGIPDEIEALPEDVIKDPPEDTGKDSTQETSQTAKPSEGTEKGETSLILSEKEIMGEAMDGGFYITDIRTDKVSIIIPDTINGVPVVSIAGYVLSGTNIESVTFPDTLELVGEAEFSGCENLKNVNFGKGLKYIGTKAFYNCNKLERVTFPEGMQLFDDVTFYSCANLKEVSVPASATEFGVNTPILDPKTCPDAVVVTSAGSPAQKVCNEKGIPVETK